MAALHEFRRAWTVVLAAAVGVGLGITGLPIYTTGQFILPLQTEFGWSRSATSSGFLCLTVVGVVMAPIIGILTERHGVRRVAMISMIGLAGGFALLTLNAGSLVLYDTAWTMLAVLGAGTSPIVWTRAVAGWFDRQRGLALGLTLCGTGVVAMIAPGLIGGIIAAHGWRAGFWTLSVAQLLIGLPIVFFLFRAHEQGAASVRSGLTGPALRQVVRRRQLWQLLAAFFLVATVIGGMIVHLPAMLADEGVPLTQAAQALGLLGMSLIVGRLAIGALMDRLPATLVAPVFVILPVFSCFFLSHGIAVMPSVILVGLSAGAEVDLLAYIVSRYFGMVLYSRIYGWSLSMFSAGVGLGPMFAGWVHDRSGGYQAAFHVFIGFMGVASVLIATLGRPDPEAAQAILA